MEKNIMSFINTLEGFKTAIKNAHWSSNNMSEHKLCDDIAETLNSTQDEIAEIAQGLYGQIKKTELEPTSYKLTTLKTLINDLTDKTNEFYQQIDGDKNIGLRSTIETFIGQLNKFQYLNDLCIKENIKKKLKTLKENKMAMTESEIRSLIKESIRNVKNKNSNHCTSKDLKEIIKENVEKVLREISYSTARNAYLKMLDMGQHDRGKDLSDKYSDINDDYVNGVTYDLKTDSMNVEREDGNTKLTPSYRRRTDKDGNQTVVRRTRNPYNFNNYDETPIEGLYSDMKPENRTTNRKRAANLAKHFNNFMGKNMYDKNFFIK